MVFFCPVTPQTAHCRESASLGGAKLHAKVAGKELDGSVSG
jgi:hypothetical protein